MKSISITLCLLLLAGCASQKPVAPTQSMIQTMNPTNVIVRSGMAKSLIVRTNPPVPVIMPAPSFANFPDGSRLSIEVADSLNSEWHTLLYTDGTPVTNIVVNGTNTSGTWGLKTGGDSIGFFRFKRL